MVQPTEAIKAKVDETKLANASRKRVLEAVHALRPLLETGWEAEELTNQFLEIDEQVLKLAVNLRRALDLAGKKVPASTDKLSKNPEKPRVCDLQKPDDLRLALDKIVHHVWLRPSALRPENITIGFIAECDRGNFTEIKLSELCNAAEAQMKQQQT